MPKNAIKDFLETANPDTVDIICPACGTPMGITQEGSYEMILTVNARKEINDIISLYRRYLQGFERELKTLNIRGFNCAIVGKYPYKREQDDNQELKKGSLGLYNIDPKSAFETFVERLDYYEWYSLLHQKLPPLSTFNNTQEFDSDSLISNVLEGFEPALIIGPIMNLVLDQIRNWMNDIKLEDRGRQQTKDLRTLIEEVCPYFYGYFSLIEKLFHEPEFGKKYQDKKSKDLQENFIRRLYVLAILFGHESPNANKLSHGLLEPDIPFDLPKLVIVSPMRLQELVTAKVITRRKGFSWSDNFLKVTRTNSETDNEGKNDGNEILAKIIKTTQGDINKFVHFVCTGQSGSKSPEDHQSSANKKQETDINFYTGIKDQCGWYPKEELTHPVVLIGSPGTGKSTVMLTGLTTFYDNAQALGMRVILTSNEDIEMVEQYTENFWKGILPSPTKEGTRHSIQLTVESTSDVKNRANFVFTDIPGEVAARSMKREGTHPIVLGVLKHTETIIFFFDLSIEPSIRAALTHGKGKEEWKELQDSFEQTLEERREENEPSKQETGEPKSRAEISQIQLLGKLIQDLREIRNEEDIRHIHFVCVIPKLDIFIANDEEKETIRFLSGFCKELEKEGLLIRSRYTPENETLKGLRSVGGSGFRPNPQSKTSKRSASIDDMDLLETQRKVIHDISDKAIDYLKKIGDALGTDDVEEADKTSLTNRIEKGLIETLQTVFGKERVYILPVSAQGDMYTPPTKNTKEGGKNEKEKIKKLGYAPSQKLAEYVFITPAVLAMPKTTERQSKEEEKSSFNKRKRT
ncbi:MAG: hypothetical protein VSS75_016185 [Candidatus Parabeggiatoa sp.]|nr:hypothetical protein [Candidatus Parabeggiatoa sp.]